MMLLLELKGIYKERLLGAGLALRVFEHQESVKLEGGTRRRALYCSSPFIFDSMAIRKKPQTPSIKSVGIVEELRRMVNMHILVWLFFGKTLSPGEATRQA
jgi:hypothetical protein